jgi:phage gpG-like protein
MANTVHVTGAEDYVAAVTAFMQRVEDATVVGVERGSAIIRQEIRVQLTLSTHLGYRDSTGALFGAGPRRLNKRRTRVDLGPSAAGTPPALQSGFLRQSVTIMDVGWDGGQYTQWIYPSTVYARIQELGGEAGKDHRATLPPRPYVEPALAACSEDAVAALISAWFDAAGG